MRQTISDVAEAAGPFSAMSRLFLRFGFLGAAQLAGSALSFLTAVIITRFGGAAVFGQVSIGLSVLAYALIVTNFGTDISGVRMAAAQPERIGAMLPAILLIRLFFGTLTFVFILLSSLFLAPDPVGRAILLIICAGVFAVPFFPAWLPQSLENIKVTALCVFGPFALTFAFTSISAILVPHGIAFAASRLAGDVMIAMAVSLWARRFFDWPGWPPVRATVRSLIGQSSAIAGSELVRGLAFLSDMLIVASFFHDATIGHFSAAYRIYLLLVAVAAMYSIVLFPRLSRAAVDGAGALKAELRSTLLWTVPIASLLALALIAIVPWVLPFAFGADFSTAVPALQFLAVAATLNFIHRNYSRTLVAMHLANVDLHLKSAVTIVGIALKIAGTWRWGITGMAAAILLSELILLVLLQWNMHRRLRVGTVA